MTELLIRALHFAAHKHRDQRRKDNEASPYINHPIDVMTILAIEAKIDDVNILAAALLHDTLEDTETTFEELQQHFGNLIAGIVVELTDDQDLPRPERYQLQQQKAVNYSREARLIRIADKIANTRDASRSPPATWSFERLEGHFNQSLDVMALLRKTHQEMEDLFDTAYQKAFELIRQLRNPD